MTTAQLSYSSLPPERRRRGVFARVLKWLGGIMFWTWLAMILVAGTAWAVSAAATVIVGGITGVALILLLVAGAIFAHGARRVRDLSVLHYLDQALRLNTPLPTIIAAAERGERGSVRARLAKLRKRLEAGDAVAAALAAAAPSLPRRMIGLTAAGESTGRLSASVRRATARRDFFPAGNPVHSIFLRWYPMILLVLCVAVADGMLIYIMPKFDQMLRDYHLPASPMKRLEPFAEDVGPMLLLLWSVIMAIFCGRMLAAIFTPAGVALGPFRKAADYAAWFAPIAGGVIRNRALADACHVMAGALDAGLPEPHAITAAANAAPNAVMQRKLKRWAFRVSTGDSLSAGAKSARLPRLLRELLAAARTNAEAVEVFGFLCRHYDEKFSRSAMLLRAAIIPGSAIVFGIIVCALALGVFQPLVDIMLKFGGR